MTMEQAALLTMAIGLVCGVGMTAFVLWSAIHEGQDSTSEKGSGRGEP